MSGKIAIFYIGATGYIGGSVLQAILAHPKAVTFEVTALVRSEAKAKALKNTLGIQTVVGSIEDHTIVTKHAEEARVANADDDDAMKAILTGLRRRYEKTGEKAILIHMSGAGLLVDDARGEYASSIITSDLDLAAIERLPASAPHQSVHLLVKVADIDGYAMTYILLPGMLYGRPKGALFDGPELIANPSSFQIPTFARAFAKRGRAGVIGKGATRWPNIHIDDNADAYFRLFDAALFGTARASHGREGYFFVEGGEHSSIQIVRACGEALAELGLAREAEPDVLTAEERVTYFGSDSVAFWHFSNARCTADRLRKELGWAPKYTTDDFIRSIRDEVKEAVENLEA